MNPIKAALIKSTELTAGVGTNHPRISYEERPVEPLSAHTAVTWYIDGESATPHEVKALLEEERDEEVGCLNCALGIPDIHSAARMLAQMR